jgi:hypothetical protein
MTGPLVTGFRKKMPPVDPSPDALVAEYEERAAIMQFCGKMARSEAETAAYLDVYGGKNARR